MNDQKHQHEESASTSTQFIDPAWLQAGNQDGPLEQFDWGDNNAAFEPAVLPASQDGRVHRDDRPTNIPFIANEFAFSYNLNDAEYPENLQNPIRRRNDEASAGPSSRSQPPNTTLRCETCQELFRRPTDLK